MQQVPEGLMLGNVPTDDRGPALLRFIGSLVRILLQSFRKLTFRINRVLPKDGSEAMTGPLPLVSYAAASLPDATLYEGCVIYVPDGGAGSIVQVSNGTTWESLG